MAEVLPLSDPEINLLAALIRHQVRFLVVGLSAKDRKLRKLFDGERGLSFAPTEDL